MSKTKFTTTIEDTLLERIKIQAIKERKSVAQILEELIEKYLNDNSDTTS